MSPTRLDYLQACNGLGGVGRWIWSLINDSGNGPGAQTTVLYDRKHGAAA